HLPKFQRSQGSFDLHTLGTPPTFILSYDQTLIENKNIDIFLQNKQIVGLQAHACNKKKQEVCKKIVLQTSCHSSVFNELKD
ncbi:MAG TPA: hypothetical protein VHA74_00970, partial [Candidatus Dojkabacteria bacterium]|nr:hypothetical protein [Candidatus Dojkabacteria bacterium]